MSEVEFQIGEIVQVRATGQKVCVLAVFRPIDTVAASEYGLKYDVRVPDYRRVQLHDFELEPCSEESEDLQADVF